MSRALIELLLAMIVGGLVVIFYKAIWGMLSNKEENDKNGSIQK